MTTHPIHGRTVVVTGAASGIGRALALGFLADGAHVVAADINDAGLADLAGQGATTIRVDVTRDDDVRRMIDLAMETTGRVDVLFNNAGLGGHKRIEKITDDSFERFVQVHLFGAFYGLRAALPIMRQQGYGRIINTLSRRAAQRMPGSSAYASAKSGMYALTQVAAAEVDGTDILINGMIPGPTQSGMMKGEHFQKPEAVYPGALWLARLPTGGPSGQVFWDCKAHNLFNEDAAAAEGMRNE